MKTIINKPFFFSHQTSSIGDFASLLNQLKLAEMINYDISNFASVNICPSVRVKSFKINSLAFLLLWTYPRLFAL